MTAATLAKPASIAWHPLAAVPADRKDGRDVLLWVKGFPAICSWADCWCDAVGNPVRDATHYADVEGPVQ